MIYFFYGENTYSIKEKIDQLKTRFIKEQGDFDISEVSGENINKNDYSNLVFVAPFLSTKRLVIVKNLLLENSDLTLKKYIAENLEKIPDTTILIFVEYGLPDKKLSLYKKLNEPKRAQNFELLQGARLSSWIKNRVESENCQISKEALDQLQLYVGSDLWRLQNEIDKLVLFKRSENLAKIETKDVEELVVPTLNPNIFDFVGHIAAGNHLGATKVLDQLIRSGENEIKILSMIVYQYRTMLEICDFKNQKLSAAEIASRSKVHPFVIRKTLDLLHKYSWRDLCSCYFQIQKADTDIKSGQIEPNLALLLLIANLKAAPTK